MSKKFPSPITAADFSDDAQYFVFGIGYDYNHGDNNGEQNLHKVALVMRCTKPEEVFKTK